MTKAGSIESVNLFSIKEDSYTGFLVDGLIMAPPQANVVIAAATKKGKSTLALGIAVCAAAGNPAWGALAVPRPLRVAYVDMERTKGLILGTARKIAARYGQPPRDNMLYVSGRSGQINILNPESLSALKSELAKFRPDLVILDGWSWFVKRRDSDAEVVGNALDWWADVRGELNCGTLILHHTKKQNPEFTNFEILELSRGCGALMDQARTALMYTHAEDDEDIGILQGSTNRPDWNPVRFVLDYDPVAQCHRLIEGEEIEVALSAREYRRLFGEAKGGRDAKRWIADLRHRGWSFQRIGDHLDVSKQSVVKWYYGKSAPTGDHREDLRKLCDERITLKSYPEVKRWLSALRSRGWSFERIGGHVGTSKQSVHKWYHGKSSPTAVYHENLKSLYAEICDGQGQVTAKLPSNVEGQKSVAEKNAPP